VPISRLMRDEVVCFPSIPTSHSAPAAPAVRICNASAQGRPEFNAAADPLTSAPVQTTPVCCSLAELARHRT